MAIIGNDERRVIRPSDSTNFNTFPLPAVTAIDTKLFAEPQNLNGYGTGVVISPHYVLTAAHNLYDKDFGESGAYQDQIRVISSGKQNSLGSRIIGDPNFPNDPGANVNVPTGVFFPNDYVTIPGGSDSNEAKKQDIGFFRVDNNALISPAPSVGLIAFVDPRTAKGKEIQTAGYPFDNVNIPNNSGQQLRDLALAPGYFDRFGTIHALIGRRMLYSYDIDTAGGQSGSPVWHTLEGDQPRVLGVHTIGTLPRNSGVLIDTDIYDKMMEQMKGDGDPNILPENAIIGSNSGLFGLGGNDEIFGTYRRERIIGDGGEDQLYGGGANDRLEGGDGVDQALFSDIFTNYGFKITDSSNPAFEFVHSRGSEIDGTDTTKDIEFGVFEFADSDRDNKDDDDNLFYVPLQVDPNDNTKLKDGAIITPNQEVLDAQGEKIGTMTVESPAWMFDGDVKYNLSIGLDITEQYNIAFIIDSSYSMTSSDGTGTRLAKSKNAFNQLIDSLVRSGLNSSNTKFGIVDFDHIAHLYKTEVPSIAKTIINGLTANPNDGTTYREALIEAGNFFNSPLFRNLDRTTDIAYFLSDGEDNGPVFSVNADLLNILTDDVHAFGVGTANLYTLNIIDSDGEAEYLNSAGDLFNAFDTFSIDKNTIARVEVKKVDELGELELIDTITPDELVESGFNLTYSGTINGLEVSREAENDITFELVFNDGTPTVALDYKITTGQKEVRQQTNNGKKEIDTLKVNQKDFIDLQGTANRSISANLANSPVERDIVANDLDNTIQLQQGQNTVYGNGGDDNFILLGGTNLVDGGEGIDTVKINQTKAEAGGVVKDDGNTVSIGTENAIRNVEFIEFSDVRLAVDTLAITPIVSFVNKAISVSEGDNGSTLVTFQVNLSSVTTEDVVINVSARSDFADAGIDFIEPTGQLTIAAGSSSGNLTLEVLGDADIEGNEEIYLDLTVASGGTFANGVMSETVGVTVLDNETNFITNEDTPIIIPATKLLSNYANNFSFVGVNNSVNGTAVLNPDGTIKFTPSANFNGTASFEYTIADGTENKIELAEVIVNSVNDAPIANKDTITTDEDTSVTILPTELLSNDSDVDTGDSLSISEINNAINGTAVLNPDGTIKFTPSANFNGTASFNYTISDGTKNAAGAVDVVVNPDDAPIANKDTITTNEDTSVTILPTELLSNDDVDTKDNSSIVGISNSVNGTATLNQDGKIQFTPAANFNGTASFSYTLSDGTVNTTGAVDVTVNPVNDAPTIIKPIADFTVTQFAPNTIVELYGRFNDIEDGNFPADSFEILAYTSISLEPYLFQTNKLELVFGFPDNTTGTIPFTVKATDSGNESITDTFSVFRINSTQNGDQLTGVEGNDYLDGKEGDDTLTGVEGNDTLIGSEGNDSLNGDGGNDSLYGSGGNDTLKGGDGNDSLFGDVGSDSMTGGTGNDTYIVDSIGDSISETSTTSTENDSVQSSLTYTLGSNLENLTLTDTSAINGTGNTLNNSITGNTANNILSGGTGNDTMAGDAGTDTLVGGVGNDLLDGGTGIDSLSGGAGNDIYVVDTTTETPTENANEGTDAVSTSVNYTLASNLENLTLTGTSFTNGTGNDLNNSITGNTADNTLSGDTGNDTMAGNAGIDTLIGGAGNDLLDGGTRIDTLIGGAGNDIYVVDTTTETLTENANEGTDAVSTSVTYTLASNLENLTLTGTNKINGTGNDLNNNITGNSANNTLSGDAGNDTMTGGTGNDTYIVDAASDVVTETSTTSAEIDSVKSSATYTLDLNLENLTLTGTSAINGTGNTLNNNITGNTGNNTLSGGAGNDLLDGGTGIDALSGGAGNDIYVVDNTTETPTENANEGTDAVSTSVTYTLASNLENLTLTGTNKINGTGNDLNNNITGNSANNTLSGDAGNDTMTGGTGNDTYIVDAASDVVTETSSTSSNIDSVKSSATYTLDLNLENLILTGTSAINGTGNDLNNNITGNSANNTLSGVAGNDLLDGGTGIDTLIGGAGNDIYVVDTTTETLIENANQGTDSISSSVTFTLGTNLENLTLTGTSGINGTGNTLNNVLAGNSGSNTLSGAAGIDTLIGGAGNDTLIGGAGNDTLIGGVGNDVYNVDSITDSIIESSTTSTEIDTVQSNVTYTLGSNLEKLTLTGTGVINGTGNTLNNTLTGNTAANTLSGGTGNDTMTGGAGNDVYNVDSAGDVVSETSALATEIDTIQSDVTYTLGANLENLTLIGTSAINGTGNSLNNVLTGNAANNTLSGGAGIDSLIGSDGDDTYLVDTSTDTLTENVNEGIDTVSSSVTYTLGANLENLTLTGTSAINGTGNSLNNVLSGNAANNTLLGGAGIDSLIGGAGNDTMTGGIGNDTYVVDSTTDTITENVNEGIDTVSSSVTYTLGANLENLTLTGTSAINGTGNSLNNVLSGNAANNTLLGGAGIDSLIGGAGNDTMTGGIGNDTYVVDSTTDTITENANEGTDTVSSSVTYTLGSNLENLTLTGTGAINGTGNTFNNVLTGNGGNNTLSGDTGIDTLIGGAGDDTYTVDTTTDTITENLNEGTDAISSSVTYTLGANVENLSLTGTSAISGTGNTINNVLTGNSGHNSLSGDEGNDTVDGGDGNDKLYGKEGADLLKGGIGNDYFSGLSGDDTAYGGDGDDSLNGGNESDLLEGELGNDTLIGSVGNDTMTGGIGNDTYVVDSTSDVVSETSVTATEIDTVQSGVTYTLGSNLENLTLTGTSAINGTGNTLNNLLTGNGANNTLSGGSGIDTLIGGVDDDTYLVDTTTDTITENINEGTDTVSSSVTYTLAANLENLTLTGTSAINGNGNTINNVLTGNSGHNSLSGGEGNDTVDGGDGNDKLYGKEGADLLKGGIGNDYFSGHDGNDTAYGGDGDDSLNGGNESDLLEGELGNDTLIGSVGNDSMTGGIGNDTYVVDSTSDVVSETSVTATEIDTVQSGVTYTLGSNLENLTLTGTSAINGNGNTINNVLTGNTANNTLNAGDGNDTVDGGAGIDTLVGGAGDDTYIVDIATDTITENINEGTDSISSSVTYTLGANVENLSLTGTSAISGTGNTINNVLTGNSGHNSLSGGEGNDTVDGGDGNDKLYGKEGADLLKGGIGNDYFSGHDGNDTVYGGDGDDSLHGGNESDRLEGELGNDTLIGSVGNDTMTGGAGSDRFIYDTNAVFTASAVGIDQITDFVSGTDKIVLDKTTFTALTSIAGNGFNLANEFTVVGSDAAASTASALIVYSSETDNLFYNQNGVASGLGSGAQLATLSGITTLSASDFELQA